MQTIDGSRRRALHHAVISLGAILVLAAQGAARAEDAAMFRVDAAHLGVYASQAPALSSVKWRFQTGARIVSSAAVIGGVVYFGATNGLVYALRASDGTVVWKTPTKGPIESSPAVYGSAVYLSSVDGGVYALDRTSGRVLWRFATQGERRFAAPGIHGMMPQTEVMPDPFDIFLSSPAVVDGTVYIGSGDHNVYALDAQSGAVRWKFATGDVVHASPAVAGGTVYIGSWDRYFYALDAQTGAVRWKFQTGDDRTTYNQVGIAGSATVSGGMVYFGARDSTFYALNAQSGRLAWKHDEHGSWVIGTPAVLGGTVYVTTSDEKRFFGLAATTGAERLNVAFDAFSFSSPSIAQHTAYFGTFAGSLYAVDLRSSAVAGRFTTDGAKANGAKYLDAQGGLDYRAIYSEPTLEGGYVGLNRIFTLGSIAASPAIADGVLYVGAMDGTMYALD